MSSTNTQIHIGELRGIMQSMTETLKEDRRLRIEDQREFMNKLNNMDDRFGEIELRLTPLTQRMAAHEKEIYELKMVYTKAVAVIGFFSTLGGFVIAGLWWLITHWSTILTTARDILGGWK